LLAIFIGAGVGILLVMRFEVMTLLTEPLYSIIQDIQQDVPGYGGLLGDGKLAFLNLTEPFFFVLKLGILTGLILVSPILVYQVWGFLSPALEKRERRVIIPSLYFGLVLFAAGAAMAYFIALPVTIRFLLLFGQEWFTPMLTADFYLSFVVRMLLAFGLIFELPIVVMILSVMGLVTPEFLKEKRRHAIVLIAIAASFLSPGDFILLTIMMMIPLIFLYELGIVLSTMIYRRKEQPEVDPDPPEGSVSVE
jgi:sec-independent protein translocase protein TatC